MAARLMGRWTSGAPLVGNPRDPFPRNHKEKWTKDPKTFPFDDFGYHEDDKRDSEEKRATRCPVGAHIRRANPRDGLIDDDPEESKLVSERHQLIRRGRPYREVVQGQKEEGMFFVALNASLRRQFEFVQHSWLNNPKFGGQYDSRDPITGDNYEKHDSLAGACPASYSVVLAEEPVPRRITGLPRFVHVRGGAYFFLPGIRALRFLASLSP